MEIVMDMPPCTLIQRGDICIARLEALKLEGRGSDPNQAYEALQAELQRLKAVHEETGGGSLLLDGIATASSRPAAPSRSLAETALHAVVAALAVLITLGAVGSLGVMVISRSIGPLDPVMALKQGLDKVMVHAEGLTPEGAARLRRNVRILVDKATPVAIELKPLVGALTPSCPPAPQIKP